MAFLLAVAAAADAAKDEKGRVRAQGGERERRERGPEGGAGRGVGGDAERTMSFPGGFWKSGN